MEIKWYGTATLAYEAEDQTILFDPFFPMNPALPTPNLKELAGYGEIFITHGHFDHLIDVPAVVEAGGGPVFCSAEAAETLGREGVAQSKTNVIGPGDQIERGPFKITAFRGKHIRFDLKLILQTLFNRRMIAHSRNLIPLLKGSLRYPKGEVLVFLIEAEGKKILHLGSLSLDDEVRYPRGVDLLMIPYQGRSDLLTYTPKFLERLEPQALYLHHFDDSFPPVSSPVEVQPFIDWVKEGFPGMKLIQPEPFKPVSF
jgi:L-ascorbate metabolism protein UlaG (beta-lactamase superfamily)